MEETNGRGDLLANVVKQSSLRSAGSLKVTLSGRSTPRSSPFFRKLRTPRREIRGSWGRLQFLLGNRVVLLLILITVWAYLGFYVQSKWAHNEHNKPEFVGYRSIVGSAKNLKDETITVDTLVDKSINSSRMDSVILKDSEATISTNFGVNLVRKGRHESPRQNAATRRNGNRLERRPHNSNHMHAKFASGENTDGVVVDEGIRRRNTSYGLFVGPFGKTEDTVLGWSADRRKGTCRKGEFSQVVSSRKFVLIFHELSMTGAPLSMMELATEILSCGGSVSVVVLSRKGGLIGELNRRRIKVLKDKGKLSYKAAMKADLIIAGSAVCSSWIGEYLSHFAAGSTKIIWWIMENRREYFDRSKHMLNQVKMLIFLSESQLKQWLTWCKEEHIQLKAHPTTVPLSVNEELAFVAGIPSSLSTPSFNVENMQEKRKLLRVAVRKEMGLADDDMLAISLSSINPGKGQLLFLESVLLMAVENVSSVDLKIDSLTKEKNLSSVTLQDEKLHQGKSQEVDIGNELEDVLLQINENINDTVKKRKRRKSRLSKLTYISDSIKTKQQQDVRRLRNLLSDGEGQKEPALKVLIGSIGSKSNKLLYVKGILNFLSQHPNLLNSLLWTPATTHVSSLYAAADVYVINAQGLGETFGRVTIEAMAFGLPVLGTDAGGTREIVEDKVTGLLHPIGQEGVQPLARHLQFLLRNPTARKQLGNNGRLKVEKMYLKQHMYKKLADVFVQCIKIK